MKKIAKKLLFSSLALSASVLTLTTTTYAWYVQNNTATVTNISASTGDEVGNSLFISKDASTPASAVWSSSITFENSELIYENTLGNMNGKFVPMSYNPSDSKFHHADTTEVSTTLTSTYDGEKLVVNMWLMCTTDNVSVRPTLRLQNTTASADVYAQKAYTAIKGTSTDLVAQNGTFWTDAAQALRMTVATKVGVAEPSSKYYDVMSVAKQINKNQAGEYVQYAAIACPKTGEGAPTTIYETGLGDYTFGETTLKGAHGYYRTLVGAAPLYGFTDLNASHMAPTATQRTDGGNPAKVTGEANGMDYISVGTDPVKVTFTIWLEGTDVSCFDCCVKQAFNFAFDFDIVA